MKPIVVFQQLKLAVIPVALLFRAFGWRVIFIEPLGTIRNNLWIERLNRIGIEWVDYLSYPNFNSNADFKITGEYSEALCKKAFQQKDFSLLCELTPALEGKVQMARSLLFNNFITSMLPNTKTYALAEYFINQGHKAYVYQTRSRLINLLTQFGITPVKNLCPFSARSPVWKFFYRRFKALLNPIRKQPQAQPKTTQPGPTVETQVLYFPHQGLEYGKLFIKDNYYSKDPDSSFHQDNIRHLEITALTPPAEYDSIIDSYKRRGIKVEFIDVVNIGIKDSLALLGRVIKATWRRKACLSTSIELVISVQRVNSYVQTFKSLAGAKIALLGHDFLFPAAAVVALRTMGIKTVAVQERFINSHYFFHAPILDTYFVHGELVAQKYKEHEFAFIDSIIVSGDPRVQKIIDNKEKSLNERKKLYPEYSSVCLALDFHSNADQFINALNPTNHWKSNTLFYQAIVTLAQEKPNCLFIIRGKDIAWLQISEMQDSVKLIAKHPNITIDCQYDEFDRSYALAAMSDIIVARHSSIGDQCMAANIPVLIYDELPNGGSITSEWQVYGSYPVYCHSQAELLSRFSQTLDNGAYMPNEKFAEMRRHYYAVSIDNKIGDVKQLIQSELSNTLNDY